MGIFRRTPPVPVATQAELDELRRQVSELTQKLAETETATRQRLDEADGRIVAMGARITQVGTEVTHQFSELSGDIESLDQKIDGSVAAVTAASHAEQVKLANEQARYQIQFRQDLAEIADRVNRAR